VARLAETIVGISRGYGVVYGASGCMECCTSGAGRPPIQTIMLKTDGGRRKVGKMGGREEIHCMDHNEKS